MTLPATPSAAQMDRLALVLKPLSRITSPYVQGVETLPPRGALYVGNHTIFGLIDLPFMMSEVWQRRGIVLRGLGDHGHYAIPVWRDLLELCGMVRGTRENVRALMAAGEDVLVFPGGSDEVFKGKGQKYELLWKERLGFARLAIEFGYPVVPFSAVGVEEMYDVIADSRTPGLSQVSALMKRLVGLPLPPLAAGLGPTLLPRPERLYFGFAPPIDTARFGGDANDDNARLLRDEVRAAVLAGIAELHDVRERDPDRGLVKRLRGGVADEPLPALAQSDPPAHFVATAFDAWNTQGPASVAAWTSDWVELIDPPERPDAATWEGRDAALGRLEQVAAELGGAHIEVLKAHSVGDQVQVDFEVRSDTGAVAGAFVFLVDVEDEQIVRVEVRAA